MALYSSHTSVIKRSIGQNAISCAAYNSRSKLTLYVTDKETNITVSFAWDYSKKGGLAFSKIYAQEDAPEWVYDREKLWNKAETSENRCDARPARKIRKALPIEFTEEQNIALLEEFVTEIVAKGMIVDAAIHNDTPDNPHVHLMLTMRELVKDRYGEYEFSLIKNRDWNKIDFVNWHRELWETLLNKHYKMYGFDITVSRNSYKAQDIELEPGVHEGASRNISDGELVEVNRLIAAENAEKIKAKPGIILNVVGMNQPVFTKEQIATELEKRLYAGIDFAKMKNIEVLQSELSATFINLYEQILNCPEISQLVEADLKGRTLYTTTKRLELEERFTANVEELHSRNNHVLNIKDSDLDHLSPLERIGAKARDIATNLVEHVNDKTGLNLEKPKQPISLSLEQRKAVVNILNGVDISVLEGIPGAGKTTAMHEIVRQYKKAGFKVIGVAPSSAASLELAKATGIKCKNATLWRKEWLQAQGKKFELILRGDYYKEDLYKDNGSSLTRKHVMIIDEASMGEMANMDYLISEARAVGAKMLLVGDNNQLAPVGWAGALDKTISICGSERLEESRRQQNPLHREATRLLSQYRVREALDIYWKEGAIKVAENEAEANSMAVRSFVNSYIESAKAIGKDDLVSIRSKAIPVFKNETRDLLNNQVREQLKEAGILKGNEHRVLVGSTFKDGKYEKQYLNLQRGEQIVFAKNANRLGKGGVFNSELGTILKIHKPNKDALAVIDILVHKASGKCEKISLDLQELATNKYTGRYFHDGKLSIDYGYAVTSHKVQGASIKSTVPRFEKGTGYEVGNVILTRHKEDIEIVVSKEVLYDSFYESLDKTVSEARNRFDIEGEDEETILKGGLAKMLSKRTNTSFASDYRTMGQTEEDKIIKHYLDKSEETIAAMRKITSWQDQTLRKTGKRPQMWDTQVWEHEEFWEEFKIARTLRNEAAGIIESGDYSKFKDRLIQLNMNYATIEKHASQLSKGNELDKVIIEQKTTILHQQDNFKELVQSVSGGQTIAIRNSYRDVNLHIAETTLAIEEKNTAITEIEDHRQELTDAIETEEHYRKILTPEYLNRIYHTFKGTKEDAGTEALGTYQKMVQEHGEKKATKMVIKDPTILGALKGYGVGRLFGVNNARKDAIALCQNLEKQLQGFNRSGDMVQQYKTQMQEANFGEKIFALSVDIEHLRSLLPADIDNEFLESVGTRLNSSRNNNIDWRDLQKSELFDAVRISQYTERDTVNHGSEHDIGSNSVPVKSGIAKKSLADDTVIAQKPVDGVAREKDTTALTAIKAASTDNTPNSELKQTLQQKDKIAAVREIKKKQSQSSKPRLTFADVKAGLNQSVVSEIFRQYAPAIIPNKKVERLGSEIKIGSLYMSISGNKTGLWNRFSNGSNGDIFSFVEEATGCSKYESLEIVASHAGITQAAISSKFADGRQSLLHTEKDKDATQIQDIQNIWVARIIVPDSAPLFNAEKDLAFLAKKGSNVTNIYEYRNRDNQLLGYAVRIEDGEAKKQVLPVAYCQNAHLNKSRWQLKGFSDAGSKPIYGLEKLEQQKNKPILIVEGEKTADAAGKLFPDHNVISWMGGVQAVDKVDWSKLENRLVTIWPDNDKPGIEAANSITNHIDCHNGFTGLVSVVNIKQLDLPEKWDLADDLPNGTKHVNLEEIITNTTNNNMSSGKKLESSQGNIERNAILGSLDILIAQGKICKDEFTSQEMHHATIIAIAKAKNIDLNEHTEASDFLSTIQDLQDEYRNLRREYERGLRGETKQPGEVSITTQEQLIHELVRTLVRDISILQQMQPGAGKLTAAHAEHITMTAKEEVSKMQRFTDSDKEHAASNLYKTVTSSKWLKALELKNQEKTEAIKGQFKEQRLEAEYINSTLAQIGKEKQEAKTPEKAIGLLKKQQEFLAGLHGNLKYPEYYSKSFLVSIKHAEKNQRENAISQLHKLAEFVQNKQFKTAEEITKILKNSSNPMQTHKNLLQSYQENFIGNIHKGLRMLEKGETFKLDKQSISCPMKFLEQIVKTRMNEYAPRHEVQKIQTKIIEHHKQLEMSKDMGGFSL